MNPASPAVAWHRRLPPWAWVLVAATAAGLFFGAQIYYSSLAFRSRVSWPQALYWSFGDWYEWALLSPVIFWMCRRFRFDDSNWRVSLPVFVVGAVVIACVHAFLCTAAAQLLCMASGSTMDFFRYLRGLLAARTPFNLASFFMIVCAWYAWDYCRRYRGREERLRELERQLASAQLFALRMQLNPHFLFNTLNTISSLMLTDVRAANQMISRLGALLRDILEREHEQEVTLEREIEVATRYLEIERARFGDRLAVVVDAPENLRSAAVPTFILQPLIENAIRHAIDRRHDGGKIALRFRRTGASLLIHVSDNGGTIAPRGNGERGDGRESIGLGNTKRRLEKLYGEHQSLRLDKNPERGTTVEITVPFRTLALPTT